MHPLKKFGDFRPLLPLGIPGFTARQGGFRFYGQPVPGKKSLSLLVGLQGPESVLLVKYQGDDGTGVPEKIHQELPAPTLTHGGDRRGFGRKRRFLGNQAGLGGRAGWNGELQPGLAGLSQEGHPASGPIVSGYLIQRAKQGHGAITVAYHIGGPLLLDALQIGTEFGFELAGFDLHMTKLV